MRHRFLLVACIVALVVLPSCKGRSEGSGAASTTIAPQAPANTTDTSSDTALTQTVDVVDGRSEAEGGTSTATAVQKKTGAAAASRKQPTSQSRPPGRTQ